MTIANRLKLVIGLVVILLIGGALVLLFNHRQARVTSETARVVAPAAAVGAAYGGVVTDLMVSEGQRVSVGQPLLTMVSQELKQDIALGAQPSDNIAFAVDRASASVTYKAVRDGYVHDLNATVGSYLSAGAQLATVIGDGDRSVEAIFSLDPTQYQRVEVGASAEIVLPDNTILGGTVRDISVTTSEGYRTTTHVTIACEDLNHPRYAAMARQGSPVTAIVSLRDDGFLAGPTDSFMKFLTKIGLR
ncbi:HlyD family secretion protein [Propionibacterium cyclohexanicum]|uniref:HlyD family secretion protein n=1 Tax=Propionibacterium cyclohexanicum TaxID=64702 RepID=A0A1H9RF32_9ACTN|nr:HlyD family secretion protein [Propionibacterium cyclohexanicum]SER71237.1 HlyD family secretion protein [Propionibacterium cyclohexanicum]